MTFFTASFSKVSVAAIQDIFEIVAGATTRVAICEIEIMQGSDAGDAESEVLPLEIWRGYDTSGSGGAAVTPVNLQPWSRDAASTVERNNTTIASDGTSTAVLVMATAWNVQGGWFHKPSYDADEMVEDERIWIRPSERLVLRLATAPADAFLLSGYIKFEEVGKMPVS